jgi:hypothetical protein
MQKILNNIFRLSKYFSGFKSKFYMNSKSSIFPNTLNFNIYYNSAI